ncbi:hypothetical protein HQN86_24750 [Pedobacter panaciterrae]|uniref:hypothetical protein n=1 Tax=Pedobacter panaciterrae TaxID=363849 RepID=UPI00155DCCAE|nr:hypothetical protein [Pedobacter panaciterrae]NQX56850.1 hypothetical protein [Pedobacter panaciterrae]
MATKPTQTSTEPDILKDAGSIWKFLIENAGNDPVFYDKDFLKGNEDEAGLYTHLKIKPSTAGLEKDLIKHKISSEQFIVALFKTLQPYSQMMSDLCVFFERHEIKTTNKNLRIEFDFSKTQTDQLAFDLKHFRETIKKLTRASRIVNYYFLHDRDIWQALRILDNYPYPRPNIDPSVSEVIKNFREKGLITQVNTQLSLTGNVRLDKELARLYKMARSFIDACLVIGRHQAELDEYFRANNYGHSKSQTTEELDFQEEWILGWPLNVLYIGINDHWPYLLIQSIFEIIERLSPGILNIEPARNELAEKLNTFMATASISRDEQQELLTELANLLSLPVWKQRHELYAAWILSLMDKTLEEYPSSIHHNNGLLSLSFSATRLISYETNQGNMELWSEVRSPLKNPSSKSRTANIQPDYTIYKHKNAIENCVAVVEVKQYRKPSSRKFTEAINDYANGLPYADVFLVNYGSVHEGMLLDHADRSFFFGLVRPDLDTKMDFTDAFKNAISTRLPPPFLIKVPGLNKTDFNISATKEIYIDVSSSLDTDAYRSFLNNILEPILVYKTAERLIAVDTIIRQEWQAPDAKSISELTDLDFSGATDFAAYLPELSEMTIVVTDEDGAAQIQSAGKKGILLVIFNSEHDIRAVKI